MTFLMVGLLFLCFFIALELIKRHFRIDAEFTRKFAHIFGGACVLISINYISKSEFIILTTFFLIGLSISHRAKLLKSFTELPRKTYGEITYLLGLAILGYLFFDTRNIFICGILLLMFPDSIAGLIGYHINKNKKTLVGSAVYFIITVIILMMFFPIYSVILTAIVLTLVEYFSSYGFDNLTVPIAYTLLIKLFLI
jgi:dolichol kinase